MKEIFLNIQHLIKTKINETEEHIRFIDFDLGQLDQETPPVSFPCVLISFGNTGWLPLSSFSNIGETTINLRVGFKIYERTHSKNNPLYQTQALAHLDVVALLKKIIITKSGGTTFTKLKLINENNETRADLRIYNLSFTSDITEDYSDTNPYVNWKDLNPAYPIPAGPGLCVTPDLITN